MGNMEKWNKIKLWAESGMIQHPVTFEELASNLCRELVKYQVELDMASHFGDDHTQYIYSFYVRKLRELLCLPRYRQGQLGIQSFDITVK